MKDDYMRKMNSINTSSGTTLGSSSFIGGIKDIRVNWFY